MTRRDHYLLLASAALLVLAVAAGVSLHRSGISSRVEKSGGARRLTEAQPLLAETTTAIYELWKREEVAGRVVVHLSRFLHFEPVGDETAFVDLNTFPIRTFDLVDHYELGLGPRNFLWVALNSGIARRVHHVLPPAELDKRVAAISPDAAGVSIKGRTIHAHENGSRRLISDQLPDLNEPVLLLIDASYLLQQDPLQVLQRLKGSTLATDLLVLCRSQDNPDVGPLERQRLARLNLLLRRGNQ